MPNLRVVLAAAAAVFSATPLGMYIVYRYLRRLNLGKLPISTASVAYKHDSYGNVLTWDNYAFKINGSPVILCSGEFHPWRVPDRERWKPILETYKAAGLNCIRIYFHWGYHSPGPYICAETQAGGHPIWLVAKKHVRIRHSVTSYRRVYDAEYSRYCREWLLAMLPIIARHQVTVKQNGCVLALQIENESFENFLHIPLGLADDMRYLSKVARDECKITVPLFHNDAFEADSFNAHPPSYRVYGKEHFGLDLYSFDKYVVFAPTSAPLSNIMTGDQKTSTWKPWTPETVEGSLDGMEMKVRGFKGAAASGPIFIAELQGGWFNHYSLGCTYDNIYEYYGENYTRLIFDTCISQGVTAFNYYMFYGGTNWGTLGDPDVYTSYDYSACIREYGFLSGRGRKLRLGLSFARTFSPLLSRTDAIPANSATVTVNKPRVLNRQRVSVGTKHAVFTFLRNFCEEFTGSTENESKLFSVSLNGREGVSLICKLPYKQSFISLGNYRCENSGILLLLSTVPIHMRTFVQKNKKKTEVWIIQCDNEITGEMAFDGDVKVIYSHGSLQPSVRSVPVSNSSIVSFAGHQGWCSLSLKGAEADELLILALTGDDIYTLCPSFEEPYWCASGLWSEVDAKRADAIRKTASANEATSTSWGAYGISYNPVEGRLELQWRACDKTMYFIPGSMVEPTLSQPLQNAGFIRSDGLSQLSPYSGFPGLYFRNRDQSIPATPPGSHLGRFSRWSRRVTDFDKLSWKPLAMGKHNRPTKDTIDLLYTSGHVFYRVSYVTPKNSVATALTINVRHRCQVYVNGKLYGGHTTYSLQLMRPGAKNGPDFLPHWYTYTIPSERLNSVGEKNEVILVIESYGLSRQAFSFNDVRSPRGLLGIKVEAVSNSMLFGQMKKAVSFNLAVAGVDVTTLSQIFAVCGFPDESSIDGYKELLGHESQVANGEDDSGRARLIVEPSSYGLPTWYSGHFRVQFDQAIEAIGATKSLRIPLRLHVTGPASAHIWIEDTYIARYHGNGDSVQKDFAIPEALVAKTKDQDMKVKVLLYGRSDSENYICLEALGWENQNEVVASSPSERWSGNLVAGGSVFATLKESVLLK
ncbi:hypothetical protein HDV05_008073 [Chytridiales sp. JEL 0842]|nr:hypothetical protein HDV05_008073 [Chytridiales sp. JEL 0842]